MNTLGTLEKFEGALVGCAVGDALGRNPFLQSESPRGYLRWTDDTHMTIGVAESLIARRGFDGEHMIMNFMKNYELEPWRGYAVGPPTIFKMIKMGVHWQEAAGKLFGGMGSYGNGGAMRISPVGLVWYHDPPKLREIARAVSGLTHAHELGKEGAALQARAVALAVEDTEREEFLEELRKCVHQEIYLRKIEKIEELLKLENKRKVIEELGNGIEAHNSVPTAIYSHLKNDGFTEALEYAISLGGDTDTIGAMTGAISGARYGIQNIPEEWRRRTERVKYIMRLARELHSLNAEIQGHGRR